MSTESSIFANRVSTCWSLSDVNNAYTHFGGSDSKNLCIRCMLGHFLENTKNFQVFLQLLQLVKIIGIGLVAHSYLWTWWKYIFLCSGTLQMMRQLTICVEQKYMINKSISSSYAAFLVIQCRLPTAHLHRDISFTMLIQLTMRYHHWKK